MGQTGFKQTFWNDIVLNVAHKQIKSYSLSCSSLGVCDTGCNHSNNNYVTQTRCLFDFRHKKRSDCWMRARFGLLLVSRTGLDLDANMRLKPHPSPESRGGTALKCFEKGDTLHRIKNNQAETYQSPQAVALWWAAVQIMNSFSSVMSGRTWTKSRPQRYFLPVV